MHRALYLVILLAVGCGPALPEDVRDAMETVPTVVDFNFHVKPILSDRCFKCHGPDANTRVEDIRFDTPEGIRTSRRHLRKRILASDPEVRMPPPESNLSLVAREKAVLVRWLEQGADYEPHWAFQAPVRPEVPSPMVVHAAGLGSAGLGSPAERREDEWPTYAIDRFVQAGLATNGLAPAGAATAEAWLRRVYFTLTGLPPSTDDIDAFLLDSGIEARRTIVDRLLASPAYGERMAVDWLDLARYADSHGYQDDGWRNMWPWRDWVISAFNRNMPYDEFVTWQLAGDLLPKATREQILATGFNRNHLQSQEGGIVLEEYRVDYVADRTNTFGKAFLGLTTECARCHDHKYDPVTQAEYFGLFAFFNSVNEVGNIPYAGEAAPTVLLTDDATQTAVDSLGREITRLEALVDPAHSDYNAEYDAWTSTSAYDRRPLSPGLIAHFPLDGLTEREDLLRFDDVAAVGESGYFWGDRDNVPTVVAGLVDSALVLQGDGWLDTGNTRFRFERSDPFTLDLLVRLESPAAVGPLMGKSGGLFNGNRGYMVYINPDRTLTAGLYHVGPDNAIEVVTADSLNVHEWQRVTLTYDGSSRAAGIALYLDGIRLETRTVVDNLHQSIVYTIDPFTGDSTNWGDPGNLRIGFTETNQPMLEGAALDDFRVFDRALTPSEIPPTVAGDSDAVGMAGPPPSMEERRAYFVTTQSPLYRRLFAELTDLRRQQNRLLTRVPSVMVMRDTPEARPTHILNRGAYDQPLAEVVHATPDAILPFPPEAPKNRLGLANWLFDARNPLTARVAINRLWQQVFGRGLVATSDNFGSQGALPTHPELLDWLAVEYMESGWDTHHMLRLMVLSETFARASEAPPVVTERDPDNRWLARWSARRLSAEMMRDQALAASGLLVREIGGPPVKPYQPDGLWAELATRNGTRYEADSGDRLHRRSMYTLWKRTIPPPMMLTFDASERNVCTIQRQSTSTPLQALVLMNDPQFFEAARVLGQRMILEGGRSTEGRVRLGFLALTGRSPSPQEVATLSKLVTEQIDAFASRPSDARRLLQIGEHPPDRSIRPQEAAAWAIAASTIMNFDGTTTLR